MKTSTWFPRIFRGLVALGLATPGLAGLSCEADGGGMRSEYTEEDSAEPADSDFAVQGDSETDCPDEDCDGLTDEWPEETTRGFIPETCDQAADAATTVGCAF